MVKDNPIDNAVIISLDMDWAPDFILESTAKFLEDTGIKSTWFVTHDSEFVQYMATRPDLFELGIHPNFFSGSTHGEDVQEILNHLLKIVPGAVSVRTHGLYQYSGLIKRMCVEYGLKIDSSIFLPFTSNIRTHQFEYGEGHNTSKYIMRAPYFWGDYSAISRLEGIGRPDSKLLSEPGLKIFNFHPIHVGLNSSSLAPYEKLKKIGRIIELNSSDIASCIDKEYGVSEFLSELTNWIQLNQQESYFIKDLIREKK